jgi:hypothetical protein
MELRAATREDLPALGALFAAAFGAELDAREWIWKYHDGPNPSRSVIAVDAGRALGFYGGWGTRYLGREGVHPGVSATDVMTDPAARSLGHKTLFKEMGEAYCRLNLEAGAPFYFGFPHERARIIGERFLGYRAVERAGQLRRALPLPVRPRSLLARLAAPAFRVSRVESVGPGHDALADAVHVRDGWRTDRSRAVVNWRFGRRPGVAYRLFEAVDRRGAAHAFAAVRLVMERALLVDLQLADERGDELHEILAGVARDLDGSGAASLEIRCPRGGVLAERLRGELGFLDEESDTHLEVRPLDPAFDLDRAGPLFDYRYSDHDVF